MNFAPIVERSLVTPAQSRPVVASRSPVSDAAQSLDTTSLVPAAEQVDKQRLQAAVDAANKFLQPVARNLQFSIDEDSGKTIVKVIDTETDKVVRQIPSEEMLAISRALGRLKGVMVEQHA